MSITVEELLATKRIQSIERALPVLALIAERRRSLSLAEIAAAAGLPIATTHRILVTLTDHDWVEQGALSGRYRLGFALIGLGAAAMAYSPLVERSSGMLDRLSRISGLNAYISVLVGARVSYIAYAHGEKTHFDEFHRGFLQPAHAIAGGKAILANLPDGEWQRILTRKGGLPSYTENTITTHEALAAEFHTIRTTGVAYDRGELKASFRGVAAPVRDSDGRVIAAISTGGDVHQFPPDAVERTVEELKFLSLELSIDLGASE